MGRYTCVSDALKEKVLNLYQYGGVKNKNEIARRLKIKPYKVSYCLAGIYEAKASKPTKPQKPPRSTIFFDEDHYARTCII